MQLKLVMAYSGDFSWMIRSGSIVKWHKAEGDEVGYGDDLFDMKVEQVVEHQAAQEQLNLISIYRPDLDKMTVQQATTVLEGMDPAGPKINLNRSYFIRVSSSDRGILRRIYAMEGQHRQSGELLALLTTAESDIIDDASQTVQETSAFRVVANKLPELDDRRVAAERLKRTIKNKTFTMFWSEPETGERIGVYSKGGSPALPIFGMVPLIHQNLKGKCCICRAGWLDLRSDLLLQSLEDYPEEQFDEVTAQLDLPPGCLQPRWWDESFRVEGPAGREEFPKTVFVLSIAPDVESFCFRHNKYGFAVPPDSIFRLDRLDRFEWFQQNFTPIGKLSVGSFVDSFTRLVRVVQQDSRAHLLVLNAFTSAPRATDHNYQLIDDHPGNRRLEFNVALAEMSRQLDFSILDVDRILKRSGTGDQLTWDSAVPKMYLPLATEAYRILRERELVP